jgi:hypothetical protein
MVLIAALVACNWWAIQRWAMPPGWWSGSRLTGTEETQLQIARRYFGPILLHKTWLDWKNNHEAVALWGRLETDYRLMAVAIANLCVAIVAIWMIKRKDANYAVHASGAN